MSQPNSIFDKLSRHEIRSATLGMCLGDCNLQMRAKNARMQFAHSPKVEGYVGIKVKVINQIPGVKLKYKHVLHNDPRVNKQYPTIRGWTNTHPYFTKMRKKLYNPIKKVTKRALNSITPIGLAFWYMDDGHLSLKHNAIRSNADLNKSPQERSISSRTIILNTQGFSKKENQLICKWLLQKWKIESRVKSDKNKYWKLFINTSNSRKFVDIIRPYVIEIPCMHYKIDFKYVKDNPNLLKYNVYHEEMARAPDTLQKGDDIV